MGNNHFAWSRVLLLPALAVIALLALGASNLFPPVGGGGGGGGPAFSDLVWTNNQTYVIRTPANASVPLDLVDGFAIVDTTGRGGFFSLEVTNFARFHALISADSETISNALKVASLSSLDSATITNALNDAGTSGLNNVNVTNALNVYATAGIKNLITSNETVLTLTAWANSPSGAYDMSITGQKYSISAASAITSFSNTRIGGLANFSTFTVTNGGGSDLILYITASGYTENDGLRAYTITNKSMREIRFCSSEFGVRGISQPWY